MAGRAAFVSREKEDDIASSSLHNFEAIDEIAIVAAPGLTDPATRDAIVTHCKIRTGDRFAILDVAEAVETSGSLDLELLDPSNPASLLPSSTDFGAAYFPWISVFDPADQAPAPAGDGTVEVAPSGQSPASTPGSTPPAASTRRPRTSRSWARWRSGTGSARRSRTGSTRRASTSSAT